MKRLTTFIVVLFVWMDFCFASGQDISEEVRSEIIDKVINQLANRYVDPNLGKKAAQAIEQNNQQKAYDNLRQKARKQPTGPSMASSIASYRDWKQS